MPVDLTPLLPFVPVWLMILFRMTGIFVLAPVLGSQAIPRMVKVFLALSLSFAVWPMLWADPQAAEHLGVAIGGLSMWSLAAMVAFELLIGYLIGYAASLPMVGMQLGGHMIDQQMGLAVGGIFNPESGTESAAMGQVLFMLALALFVMAGGLEVMLTTLAQSFRTVPLGGMQHHHQTAQFVIGLVTVMFELAIRVSAPLLCLMFLTSAGMGFIMRTVPQMNILSVGFSVRILASVALLIVTVGALAAVYDDTATLTFHRIMRFFSVTPPTFDGTPPPTPQETAPAVAETSGQEKTEAPTPRKVRQAREEGNVARSTDLTAAFMMLASVVLMYVLGVRVVEGLSSSLQNMLLGVFSENPTRADDLQATFSYLGHILAITLVPLLLAMAAVGLIVSAGQVGPMLTGKPLKPQFSKLNPISGVKRLFDARAAMRLVMSLAKVILIAGVAVVIIMRDVDEIAALSAMSVLEGFFASADMLFMLAIKLSALLIVLGLLDFAFQRWQHTRDQRMTKQEVRQDMKDMDGDPMMKQRRARVARQLAMQRMAQAVPGADVIITNPTHLSIALKYDPDTMRAPRVVAKGADFMAMRIRQIAAAHDIPLVERKPLARALYSSAQVGDEVPEKHYAAVAEILAYVYRLSGKMAG